MIPFHSRLPKVAEEETRTVWVLRDGEVPKGQYGFMEFYCSEDDCDCRRVIFQVFEPDREEMVATIGWGWEDAEFYDRWGHGDGDEMKGPFLEPFGEQSSYAQGILRLFEEQLLTDTGYVSRIKRHYQMFKEVASQDPVRKSRDDTDGDVAKRGIRKSTLKPQRVLGPRARRNAPCPCGSGKKYKKCCGK